jgi:ketosteroid isomerase-like protein
MRTLTSWISTGLIALAAATPTCWAADDTAAIRTGTAAWFTAANAGKTDAVVALYAADAVVMPPGSKPLRGHAAIKPYIAKEITGPVASGITLVLDDGSDAGVQGNTGWHAGTYTVKDKSGAAVDTGAFMEIWRKTGGAWHLYRDTWNSSTPAPAEAPPAAPNQ